MEPLSELSLNLDCAEPEEPEKKLLKKNDNTKKPPANKKERKPKEENSPKRKQPKKASGNKENLKKSEPEKKAAKKQESDDEDYNDGGGNSEDEEYKEEPKGKATKGKQPATKAKASVKEKKPKGTGGGEIGKKDSDYITILEYMKEKNRPFNQTIIEGNLGTKLTKKGKNVEKVLSALVEDKELIYKDYAKARIYLINQKHFPEVNRSEMEKLNENLIEKKEVYVKITKEFKELSENLKKITSEFTNSELDDEIAKLEKLHLEADERLTFFESDKYEKISDQQINEAEKKKEKFLKEVKKRRRICNDMVGNLCDTLEKKKSQIIDELGLEYPA